MRRVLRWSAVIAIVLIGVAVHVLPVTAQRPLRLLFIGNSLTATHDVPGLVALLAQHAGIPRPHTKAVVFGGYSLEDHWQQGDARRAIAEGGWDVVVLQQGPSALPESRRLLIRDAERFAALIVKIGARPALYMVWPSVQRRGDFAGVSQSYRAAATRVKGDVFAAGEAWRLVLRKHPDIALYAPDGLHPTLAGAYLSALVIVRTLSDQPVVGLPALGLDDEHARRLQEAAESVAGRGK